MTNYGVVCVGELGSALVTRLCDGVRNPPQVLLSDIEMPGQDGFELLKQARAQNEGHPFIAIAITAYARPVDKRRAIDAGFHWHLSKPVDPGELLTVMASLLTPANAR